MTKQQKKEIKDILNNDNLNINDKITKIREIDKEEEITILWNSIFDKDIFYDYLKEQTDLITIFDMLNGMGRGHLIDSEYIYYDRVYDWRPVTQLRDNIKNDILEELEELE